MNKNKLIWIIALFLVIITSLPLAHAQIFGSGSNLFFVLINSAIVGVILFMLQTFLIPQKGDKEKTAVWVVILIASLVIGFLFGREGMIWEGPLKVLFNYFVLVNALVITTVLYFLMGLLDINKKLGSPEGKAGYGILLFIIGIIFAFKIGNKWIWDLQTLVQLKNYAFGTTGIFNPDPPAYRLWTFIGASTLLAFFFSGYLLKGVQGGNKVTYALAIVIAANMASAGVDVRSIIILGEVIFVIVLQDAMKGTTPTIKGHNTNWIFSFFLVGWASAALSYGTEYQGVLGGLIGAPLAAMGMISTSATGAVARPTGTSWFGWIFKMGGSAIFWLLLALALFFVIFRGENRRRILTLGFGGLLKRLNAIGKFARFLRPLPEDREPQFIIENRLLFHALANYTTRSEITYRYWAVVKQGGAVWKELEDQIQKFLDQKELRHDIIVYRSGGRLSTGQDIKGWNGINLEVVDLVNELLASVARTFITVQFGLKDTKQDNYHVEASEFATIKDKVIHILKNISSWEEEYKRRTGAFGAHHVLNAYKGIILNMSNPTGEVKEHPQKFARPDGEFEGGLGYYGRSLTAEGVTRSDLVIPVHEVNQFGEYVQDIVDQKDKFGNLPDPREYKKPRKLKNRNDIIDYPSYIELLDNIGKDWKGLAEDIRYGLHHPMSRVVRNYTEALGKGMYYQWRDKDIPFTDPPSIQNYALDMRALADPGKNMYWGRLRFDIATELGGVPYENPLPVLSSLGLRDFLDVGIDKDVKNPDKATEYKKIYHVDSGVFEKDLERGLFIGTTLAEAKKQQPGGQGG